MGDFDLVTFGEMLLRLEAPSFKRLEQTTQFNVCVTGAEMNAAVVASRLGLKAAHVTRLPRNPLGRMIVNKMWEQGIDTSHTMWVDDGRVGLFYLEYGAMPRTSSVLYDRRYSAMSEIKPGEVNWGSIFEGTKLFHVSGTAPALSKSSAEATAEAVRTARSHGVKVSIDLNYRAKLWSEKEAQKVLEPLIQFCNILITTEEDAFRVFKIRGKDYREVAEQLTDRFKLDVVVVTLREDTTVWRNRWTAIAYAHGTLYDDVTYDLEIVDRVGGGDAFTGGFLFAYVTFDGDVNKCLQFGNASCALKHSIPGDLNWCTRDEVEDLIRRGSGGGIGLRIRR